MEILKSCREKILTGILPLPIVAEVMNSTRTFFYFAFTYRSFFFKESGPAKFENEVLKT
jgi:hypothetical protein